MTTVPAPVALTAAWCAAFEPPPELTVSAWAEQYRHLPEASAARGGQWSNAAAPYLAGIMDATRDPRVRKIAFMKAHQSGGSEALNNVIGFHIHHDPCPILVVHPTHLAAEAFSKERLADMIRSTPELAAVVRDKAQPRVVAHQAESTLALKMFPGGFLALGGANTPNTFARWAVRLAIGDDVDRFPAVVGEEGDPADLLVNRTTSFFDALSIFVSTPTLKGGRIDTLYARSDRRRYFVPCPACGRRDWMTWSDPDHFRVVYDGNDAETARLECPCGARVLEPERRAIVAQGEWRATREPDEAGLVGFHLPAMVSTLGDVTLPGLVAKWLSARARGREALRVFINTSLAEGWEDRGARLEAHTLLSRRESYGEDVDVPAEAPCLTAGVDVQVDYFALQVMAWGAAGERWVVDWRSIPGSPKRAETQAALLEALTARYRHASGHFLPIHATCVDSGYATEEIYDFVLAHQQRRIYATKGIAGRSGEPIIGRVNERTYGRRGRPVRLYPVNVDDAKAEVMGALAVTAPGPGCLHFPELVDEEYFAQLCAEHREIRTNKSGIATHTVWVQDRERNEALDTAVLALAAFRLLAPNIRHMADTLAATTPPPGGGEPGPAPAPRPAPSAERRVSRSGYLGR
jgi:phage terminase large subunit GpA-like protein